MKSETRSCSSDNNIFQHINYAGFLKGRGHTVLSPCSSSTSCHSPSSEIQAGQFCSVPKACKEWLYNTAVQYSREGKKNTTNQTKSLLPETAHNEIPFSNLPLNCWCWETAPALWCSALPAPVGLHKPPASQPNPRHILYAARLWKSGALYPLLTSTHQATHVNLLHKQGAVASE